MSKTKKKKKKSPPSNKAKLGGLIQKATLEEIKEMIDVHLDTSDKAELSLFLLEKARDEYEGELDMANDRVQELEENESNLDVDESELDELRSENEDLRTKLDAVKSAFD